MPKVSEDHREERRQQITSAAMRCFARAGFDKTSMADIITESGLSAGAIYSYFKNKQDLIVQVTRNVLRSRAMDLDGLEEQEPLPAPPEVMRMFLAGMTRDIGNPSILVQIWAAAAAAPESVQALPSILAELKRLYERYLQAWFLSKGFDEDEAQARAFALTPIIVGVCQGYILQSALLPDFDAEAYLAALDILDL
ncbi:MAG: TetR/AcrR family transcriptional regulator [Rhodococcus sp. (in: high G+C Gram-positive bacteria)]